MMTKKFNTENLTLGALMIALTSLLSQIAIPLPLGVPINLGLLAVALNAVLLPPRISLLSILSYLLIGFFGIPVFAGFRGGASALFGVTGGFLIGYVLFTAIVSFFAGNKDKKIKFALMLLATFVLYACGLTWFSVKLGASLGKALSATVLPFIPGDVLKILLVLYLEPKIKKALAVQNT